MKKILAIAALSASVFAGNASALSVTYSWDGSLNAPDAVAHPAAAYGANYTLATTNWSSLLNLPKFNLAGYTLNSAVLTYGGEFQTTGQIDSEDATATTVRVRANVDLDFFGNGSNGSTNIGLSDTLGLTTTLFNGSLAADDEAGSADFLGGDSASGLSGGQTNFPNSFNIGNLAAITGAGNFDVYINALSGLAITGTANLSSDILTKARGQIAVTYNYTLNPPVTVPEPASLAVLGLGFAAMGFAARRRKSA